MAVLYSEKLLDHFRHPRNYGALTDADISYESFNPLCGDRIRVEVKIENKSVKEVRFKGDGCAISIASASLLTEIILNTDPNKISDDQLIAALESDIKPARIQCALLPLEALRAGLKIYQEQAHRSSE
ncbi:MAG TPA: iron-sulfur cluster assembly scaffold protein [Pyrinomonadaceae bacterium]|jgi:nitrogen fixation NifU-like protein|nr:iron-sulfur cluster assembly scaffold protein [Pyrinomonadaceae bacterium]